MSKLFLDFGDCKEVCGQQYALNLYTLAESIQAKRVLEIGSGWGWSARAFAMSLGKRGGTIISIDPVPERIKPENRSVVNALVSKWDVRKECSGESPFNSEIDLLYIDGDPREAANDFHRYQEKVRAGGLIILDGCNGQAGPTEFVESSELDFLRLPYSDVYCHAVHRKPIPIKNGIYEATCNKCQETFKNEQWGALDELVDDHIRDSDHEVVVLASHRHLKYTKGMR